MARKKKAEEHVNHERWLVSYADFITLLFAFFVVMYAVSSLNEGKYRVLSETLAMAFGSVSRNPHTVAVASQQQGAMVPKQLVAKKKDNSGQIYLQKQQQEKIRRMAADIMRVLAPLVKNGQVRITESNRGIAVEINASVLFAPGQATLERTAVEALQNVGRVLATADLPVEVEGHTDNVPINTANFPSNWELSTARASSVVRLFIASGVVPRRLTAIGLGEYRPIVSNDTAEGRSRNRRVMVLVLVEPREGGREAKPLPQAQPAAAPSQE